MGEPQVHTSIRAYLETMLSGKCIRSEVIFMKVTREAKLNNALLVVQTYLVRLKRTKRTTRNAGRWSPLGDHVGCSWGGWPRGPSSPENFTSQALNHGCLFYYYASQFSQLLYRVFIQINYCIVKRGDLMKWYVKSSWQQAQLMQTPPARTARALSGVGHGTKSSTRSDSFSVHGSPMAPTPHYRRGSRHPERVSDLPRVTQLRSV